MNKLAESILLLEYNFYIKQQYFEMNRFCLFNEKKREKKQRIVKHHHHVLEGGLDEVVTFNAEIFDAETFDVVSFLLGDLLRSGESGDDDLFLTMAPKFTGTSGVWLSESNAGSISGERSDDDEVVGAVGGEHIGVD